MAPLWPRLVRRHSSGRLPARPSTARVGTIVIHWSALCLIVALVAEILGFPDFAVDAAFNGAVLAGAGIILAFTSRLARRDRKI